MTKNGIFSIGERTLHGQTSQIKQRTDGNVEKKHIYTLTNAVFENGSGKILYLFLTSLE